MARPNSRVSVLVLISYLAFLAIGLYAGLMGVVWPSMRDGFGIDDDAYGALALATTAGSLLVIANVGRLIERVGTGRLLGNISAPRIRIEDGVVIQGEVSITGGERKEPRSVIEESFESGLKLEDLKPEKHSPERSEIRVGDA